MRLLGIADTALNELSLLCHAINASMNKTLLESNRLNSLDITRVIRTTLHLFVHHTKHNIAVIMLIQFACEIY